MKKSESIVKQEKNKLARRYTSEQAKRYVIYVGKNNHISPEPLLEKFAKETLPKAFEDKHKFTDKEIKELNKLTIAFGLETGQPLAESVEKRYWGLAMQIKRELEQEYECKTPSEKIIVDIAANSYVRKISLSRRFENCQNFEHFNSERTNYSKMLSKEIDRAHRQFISAVETLKLLRQPPIKVNVKTNAAFIGEKQQFNNNKFQKDEKNESK